jgi:uncharacterized protein YjbI with pentapeptide repeats
MADKIDPYDVGALERAVNDSATRVSGIWLSFVAFSAYLAAAASMITHRQIFLEEPIKLPTINIDLPLVASAILLPLIFVIYHVFVLLQVVLLARTAAVYNDAVEHSVTESDDRTRVRQRLANTLFAQMFAGSPRERQGVLGWLLRGMAWITLAIAPVLVLIVFEIKFLPYHSLLVTWTHRGLIAVDLLAVLLLWAGAVDPRRDISGRSLIKNPWITACAVVGILLWWGLVTIPGEPTRTFMRQISQASFSDHEHPDCWAPGFVAALISDSLRLPQQDFVDQDKLDRIIALAKAHGQNPRRSGRTRLLRGRDLRCGNLAGVDLRHADLSAAILSGASLKAAHLDGALFSGAILRATVLDYAQLRDAYFAAEEDENVKDADDLLKPADLTGASLQEAQLQGASLEKTRLQGAAFGKAQLQGADLEEADMRGAVLDGARLDGATLRAAHLEAAQMVTVQAVGASFYAANMQAAILGSAYFGGTDFERALLQGTRFNNANLPSSRFVASALWRASNARCDNALVSMPDFGAFLGFEFVPGKRGRSGQSVPIKAEAAELEKFIEKTSESVPDSAADLLRSRLRERLSPKSPDPAAEQTEKFWNQCAEKTIPTAEQLKNRLYLYETLICEPTENSRYIAEGIIRLRWRLLDDPNVKALARRLLELDGKPCPGAKDISDQARSELKQSAN